MEYIFDASIPFWDVYPAFKSIEPFKEFYEKNPQKDTSMFMWFLAFAYHTYSPLFQMDDDKKIKHIGGSLFGDEKYYKQNEKEILFYKESYVNLVDTAWDRQLRVWKDKLDEKTKYMEKVTYDEGTWDMLEKMQKSNVDLYKSYSQIIAEREKEKGVQKKGGGKLSLSDAKKI